MYGMRLMAPAGPETFIRRPNQVQNLRGWTPARGKDAAMKAPHPVRWSHNTRTALRRVRCGGRDRQKRDTAYPGECRRSHISFPCVPPWLGQIRIPYLSAPPKIAKKEAIFCMGVPVAGIQTTAIRPFTIKLWGKTKVFIHTYGGRKHLIMSTFTVVFCL